jgi:hypothetical protein
MAVHPCHIRAPPCCGLRAGPQGGAACLLPARAGHLSLPQFHLFLHGGKLLLNVKLASLSLAQGSSSPSSRPPRRVHLLPPVLRSGKLLLDPKLASISLAGGEFISLIRSSPLPPPSPDGIGGSRDEHFFSTTRTTGCPFFHQSRREERRGTGVRQRVGRQRRNDRGCE